MIKTTDIVDTEGRKEAFEVESFTQSGKFFEVESFTQSGKFYTVKKWRGKISCNCPAWIFNHRGDRHCKHIDAVDGYLLNGNINVRINDEMFVVRQISDRIDLLTGKDTF